MLLWLAHLVKTITRITKITIDMPNVVNSSTGLFISFMFPLETCAIPPASLPMTTYKHTPGKIPMAEPTVYFQNCNSKVQYDADADACEARYICTADTAWQHSRPMILTWFSYHWERYQVRLPGQNCHAEGKQRRAHRDVGDR
jgi:hypothetical protein